MQLWYLLPYMEIHRNPSAIKHLFSTKHGFFFDACLYNGMGTVYADNCTSPSCAVALLGDFAVLGGTPDEPLLTALSAMRQKAFLILVGPDQGWNHCIQSVYAKYAKAITRYALKKDEHRFNAASLQKMTALLDSAYELKPIDERLYHQCLAQGWSKDLVGLYASYARYVRQGLGFCILKDGMIVSGASSYYFHETGIEVEVDTHPDYRKQGLATVCAAALILSCLDKHLFPSWDAHTTTSLHMALKLGYCFDYAYRAYEIDG